MRCVHVGEVCVCMWGEGVCACGGRVVCVHVGEGVCACGGRVVCVHVVGGGRKDGVRMGHFQFLVAFGAHVCSHSFPVAWRNS